MVLPSGEKATERTQSLCALCFSALSSKDAAASTGAVKSGLKGWGVSVPTPAPHTLIVLPFSLLVLSAGSGDEKKRNQKCFDKSFQQRMAPLVLYCMQT